MSSMKNICITSQCCNSVQNFLADGGVRGAGGRTYWVWRSGEGWVFICIELQCDEVKWRPTYRASDKTLDQPCKYHCFSDSLLGYCLKIPPAKNHEMHYNLSNEHRKLDCCTFKMFGVRKITFGCHRIRGLPGKYLSILNISRTGRVALM